MKNILKALVILLFFYLSQTANATNQKLPEPVTWKNDIKDALFDDDKILDGNELMELVTPYRAADAAIVPISVNFKIQQSLESYVKKLTIVVDENPSPVVGTFILTPKTGDADLTTRVRIDKYTYVRAIAEFNDSKKFMVSNFVKASGGCSAPSLADMDSVMARLGKMKMKLIETGLPGTLSKAQLIISHPNFSGLQFDQLTRSEIPAHYVNSVEIKQDDKIILRVNPDISLSEDPSFMFHYINSGGTIDVEVEDSNGGIYKKKYPVKEMISSLN
jgi:sulfur-oxidizing protein SoxY